MTAPPTCRRENLSRVRHKNRSCCSRRSLRAAPHPTRSNRAATSCFVLPPSTTPLVDTKLSCLNNTELFDMRANPPGGKIMRCVRDFLLHSCVALCSYVILAVLLVHPASAERRV